MEEQLIGKLKKVSEALGYFDEYSLDELLKLQDLLTQAQAICSEIVDEDTMYEITQAINAKEGVEEKRHARRATKETLGMGKYRTLAEKLYIVKHLKERKDLTEKQKKFIEETEKVELTDKERDTVLMFYGRLVRAK